MTTSFFILSGCSATYATLFAYILIQARLKKNLILGGSCLATSMWAMCGAVSPDSSISGPVGLLDVFRMVSWYLYLLHLYQKSEVGPARQLGTFLAIVVIALVLNLVSFYGDMGSSPYSLLSIPISTRLVLAVGELLLIENLYLNLPEYARWHVALPCILLGGISCFDILLAADTVLYHRPSPPLATARVLVMIVIAPLLVLAASREQRWSEPVRLSRTAVFHSATLVLSGSVLLALAVAGELLRRLDNELGWTVELSLIFCGVIGLLLFLSSRSARSLGQRVILSHFFADRFDYRLQWLQCIATLSGTGSNEKTTLPTRAVRAVADVVDSPSGSLFLRDGTSDAMVWAGSWNMPSSTSFPLDHPSLARAVAGESVVEVTGIGLESGSDAFFRQLGPVWLAVPLLHADGVIGIVLVGPPRVRMRLDQEVFDLLRILGREVATYIAQQQATEAILQTRNLHEYGKRFAFVAHDIKNVSSQLALLLQNAEHHLANPEFQKDMLETVAASVQKIDGLLKRLDRPAADSVPALLTPVPRLEALLATYKRVRKAEITLQHDGSTGKAAISPEVLDTVLTHLLNNAIEAAPGQPVQVIVRHEAERITIDVVDHGSGMSASFVRDQLFTPFKTSKQGGSGIGAYQTRELLKEAGAELLVISQQGIGTTMRISLTRADRPGQPVTEQTMLSMTGDVRG